MHHRLLILGLLLTGPLTGYDLHRIVAAHGELYRDLKKANLYYLLDRMAQEGFVEMRTESGARGPRGERLIYALTPIGRVEMVTLLRAVLQNYEPVHSGVDVAIILLDHLPRPEALRLLGKRLEEVASRRRHLVQELGAQANEPGSAADHLLILVDAELRWIRRAVRRVAEAQALDST
ncbi:MAG: PadR family transcriptional regulator [Candidatus Dormibacteraeota bacterium]|nr:PadR family transcriptional regulator [Candidatus Dormibacteraeota bacterium]